MICSSSQHTHISCFGFCFRINRSWFLSQKHRYIIFHVYWISIHILHASKLFKYHVFVFTCVLEKSNFHFKNSIFGKYRIWFKANFLSHKNGSISLKHVLNFYHTYLYFKDITWTDFCGIYVILWDLIKDINSSF